MSENSFIDQLAGLKLAARESKTSSLNALFKDDPNRSTDYCFNLGGLHFDFSKTHLTKSILAEFENLATRSGLLEERDRLLSGQIVNPTELRPALHADMRSAKPITLEIDDQRQACYQYAERIRNGDLGSAQGGRYRYIIHLGIGGSALGPQLLLDALAFDLAVTAENQFSTHCVANVDGHALKPAMDACDPRETLVIVASKTFTTTETLYNARTLMEWMRKGGVSDPLTQMVAVTATPDKAAEFGIDAQSILTFPEGLGGRYSIWSSVSLIAMIVLGSEAFEAMRQGAAEMDEHFAETPVRENIPVIAAMLDVWYGNAWGASTRALFAYDSRLQVLVQYLQQLEMENNGKNVSKTGSTINWQSSPILWGGVGTDAQHAVFQLMHQGTHLTPVEFIAVIKAGHDLQEHHKCLLANCFAQSAALMKGRTSEEAAAQLAGQNHTAEELELLANSKTFSGNRPSTTIVLEELSPSAFGALISFYEHRSFVSGTLWQINVFDQMGVELGKELAKTYQEVIDSGDLALLTTNSDSAVDSSTQNLLKLALN